MSLVAAFLLQHSLIGKKCVKFEHLTISR